jgi:alpha-1,3-rhamnosyl/mannosyltransferase
MRRDFPALVHDHASRADRIIVSSNYAAGEVVRQLGVSRDHLTVCAPGVPAWAARVAEERAQSDIGSTILFVGSLEPRKNVEGLVDAYARLRARDRHVPPLVIAGRMTTAAGRLIDRATRAGLAGAVDFRGYVRDAERPSLYRHARMLVLPSFEEGFGLPVLEAMASGVPVVVSNRGSLPEVAGAAATPVDPEDIERLSQEMADLLDTDRARQAISRGFAEAERYTWRRCAQAAMGAYRVAMANRAGRPA